MIKNFFIIIGKILLFIILGIIVFIPAYFYFYKGFIEIYTNTGLRVITEEKYNEINKYEETINIFDLLYSTSTIRLNIFPFLDNVDDNSYNIDIEIKKESISQINNLLDYELFIQGTTNKINIQIDNIKETNYSLVNISGLINNEKINIKGFFEQEKKLFILQDKNLDLTGIISLVNNQALLQYKKDGFDIFYNELNGKQIRIENYTSLFDFNIAKRHEIDYIYILRSIDNFINENKFNKNNEIKLDIKDDLLTPPIRSYIMGSNRLSTGQKQELLIDIREIIGLLENTQIYLSKNKINIKNNSNSLIFNFNIDIRKNNINKDILKTILEVDKYFLYDIEEINNILMMKNPLLVKYINNEDFIFLLK